MSSTDLVVVSSFASVVEAQVAQSMLEDLGITSMVRSDNAGGMYPSLAAVEVLVRAEDAERAQDALSAPPEPDDRDEPR